MLRNNRYLCVLLILAMPVAAQTPTKPANPTVTIVLHAGRLRERHGSWIKMTSAPPKPILGSSVDGKTVYALIPLDDGHWELQVLSGWETGSPVVRSLQFEGDVPVNNLNFILPQLTPSPDGRFLLVRTLMLNFGDYGRSAVVVLVDLSAMQVVWRRVSSEPLIAFSRWQFSHEGELIAVEGPKDWSRAADQHGLGTENVPYDILQVNPASPGEHTAAILSVPDLLPKGKCRYRVPKELNSDNAAPEPVYDDDPPPAPLPAVTLEDADCMKLLQAAGVLSAAQLPGSLDPKWAALGVNRCEAFTLSSGRSVNMIDCRDHHAASGDGRPTWVPFQDITFAPSSEHAFEVRVGKAEEASATLARAKGAEYLIVLRKGLKLEAYKLP